MSKRCYAKQDNVKQDTTKQASPKQASPKQASPKQASTTLDSASEVKKFLSKDSNRLLFQKFLDRYMGDKFSSLEDGVEHYYGGLSSADIEKTFKNDLANLEESARSDGYVQLDAAQKALTREFVEKESKLKREFVAKYGFDFLPKIQHFNIDNELLGPASDPIRVAITGAAGSIGYSLAYRIASGNVFGPNTRVILQLIELPGAMNALEGIVMELNDCAFPLLDSVITTSNPEKGFEGVDYALLVGAKPRGPGMERSDLLQENAKIFKAQGTALGKVGKGSDTRVIVVGNPANTNALIASANAKNIPPENFAAMTRLDHNRGLAQLAKKLNVRTTQIEKFAIWGNHSATQYPSVQHAVVGDERIPNLVDNDWLVNEFIPVVQQRGAAIIKARGASSAASAASAAIDALKDWHDGTGLKWTSAAVSSNGEYGITKGLFFSYPTIFFDKQWSVVKDLEIDEFSKQRIDITHKELLQERDAVAKLL